ncbi:Dynein heavy chain 10, axonemal [Bulinus truncatus]|nr:Dynein heavy chain 10, axonemal [Bulinus truncatus]
MERSNSRSQRELPPIKTHSKRKPNFTPSKSKAGDQANGPSVGLTPNLSDTNAANKLDALMFTRDELILTFLRFMTSVDELVLQLTRKLKLEIPALKLTGRPAVDLKDNEAMRVIHDTCHRYQHQVDHLLETTISLPRAGDGPLAEIKYWKDRDDILHGVNEQLNTPLVKYMLDLHMRTEGDFEFTLKDLKKYAIEARDNVRFLSTLERHFRNLKYGVSLQAVIETIPAMMNALRMIWIISRHYNTDELMVPLMERVAWELCERVTRVINFHELFRDDTATIKNITSSAIKMLDTWKKSYFTVRARIEASGRDVRWEFDRSKLFDRTDYISIICQDLYDMAQVIEEFNNIFSQELKNVTGDPERIDEVLEQVYELVHPIAELPYDAFSPSRAPMWQILKNKFYKRVTEIEDVAKVFIDESFQSLRSSDGAFELLIKLKDIQSRETINKRMQSKFRNVILQFNKEIDIMNNLFMEHKSNPPVYRNYPPVAGAIYWCRSLFHRIKASIIRFNTMAEMMSTDIGKMATVKYVSVAKNMRKYEEQVFHLWHDHAERLVPQYLRATLLVKTTPTIPLGTFDPLRRQSSTSFLTSYGGALKTAKSCRLSISEAYEVNFHRAITNVIAETKYLLCLSLFVPEVAKHLALDVSTQKVMALDVSTQKVMGLDVSTQKVMALDVSTQKVMALDVSTQKVMALDVSTQKVMALDVSTQKVMALDVSTQKVMALDVSTQKVMALDVSTQKVMALDVSTQKDMAMAGHLREYSSFGILTTGPNS